MTFQSQASYGNDSQVSMNAQEAFNKGLHSNEGQPIQAGVGVIGMAQQPGGMPGANIHQQYVDQTVSDYQNVHP